MALVYLRFSINNQAGNGKIINTNNIESILELGDMTDPKFKMFLMNGEAVNFNQIYYQGKFIYVHNMKQLYSLLTKIEKGEE